MQGILAWYLEHEVALWDGDALLHARRLPDVVPFHGWVVHLFDAAVAVWDLGESLEEAIFPLLDERCRVPGLHAQVLGADLVVVLHCDALDHSAERHGPREVLLQLGLLAAAAGEDLLAVPFDGDLGAGYHLLVDVQPDVYGHRAVPGSNLPGGLLAVLAYGREDAVVDAAVLQHHEVDLIPAHGDRALPPHGCLSQRAGEFPRLAAPLAHAALIRTP
mmetsp:Transcript_8560/g.19478  ORF Transcript_8560/g.19478 Transcript_8560/m.19478 type:complete len:218 (+) Transcript_8560:944-1597(+)